MKTILELMAKKKYAKNKNLTIDKGLKVKKP
jgi:hypothetical protein